MSVRDMPLARWALLALCAVFAGCDPTQDPPVWDDGPPFLIVAPAEQQPESPDLGTNMYVQARGGTHVTIQTHQGTHRYGTLTRDAVKSCADVSGSRPFFFLARPDAAEAVVEARLYNLCSSLDTCVPIDPIDPEAAFDVCSQGAFVSSAATPIRRSLNVAPAATTAATTPAAPDSGSHIEVVIQVPTADAGHDAASVADTDGGANIR
jgi:hypothetical protein